MKCQKCGAKMPSDHLYCDVCGAEYQIVPDFEPEIENSIAKSMFEISEVIEKDTHKKDAKVSNKRDIHVPSFTVIFLIVLLCSIFVYIGYSNYTSSTNYRSKQALTAIDNDDYYKAAQIYEVIRKNNPQDAYWYIKEAEIRLVLHQPENAYNLAVSAIQLDENQELAYDFLMSYLESVQNYTEMRQHLENCPYSTILEKYWEYICVVPPVNYESGSYDKSLELSFSKNYQGNIYYTLDGTIPNTNSPKYEAPIKLGNGTHTITFIYENKYHLVSEPAVYNYVISSDIPMNPLVNPSSGNYDYAEMIELDIEEGTQVYYTTDFSEPTTESPEYTSPIPMPLGESHFNFMAVSEKGFASDIVQRDYLLNIKTNFTIEEAHNLLVEKLISTGHILNSVGSVENRYGVLQYFYKFPISETEINYYVFEEHYLENQINNPLNNFYAIDVIYGTIYKLIPDGDGNYTRVDF